MADFHSCEHCGHPVTNDDLPGVALPSIKGRIFRAVSRAGRHGISTSALMDRVYEDDPDGGPLGTKVIHVHIANLNKVWLRPRGLQIRGSGGIGSTYTLQPYQQRTV